MKKSLSTLLFICFLFQFTSCTDYDGETKIVYEGRILDATGNPLHGIPVSVKIKRTAGLWIFPFSYNETDIISYTNTDISGRYKMVYPKPNETSKISFLINYDTPVATANEELSSTVVYNLLEQNNNDFKIGFSDIELYNVSASVPLTIQFNQQNGSIRKINLKGLVKENYIDYNISMPGDNPSPWNSLNNIVMVAPNQLLTIQYQVQDQSGNISVQEAQVQINNQPLIYELTY